MRPINKQSSCLIKYNRNSNSDNDNNDDVEFINSNLPCNKLSGKLLANYFIIHTKKWCVITDDKDDEPPKPKANQEKKKPVKQVWKESTKALVSISDFVG